MYKNWTELIRPKGVKIEEESLSEKFALPSSVSIKNRNEQTDLIRIRLKEDFDPTSEKFLKFLEAAYKSCRKREV